MFMGDKAKLKQLHKSYQGLLAEQKKQNDRRYKLEEDGGNKSEIDQLREDAERIQKAINHLVETDYSQSVYERYSPKNPKLISTSTEEVVSWQEAFGSSFEAIPKTLRHSLVGLVEGYGRYRFRSKRFLFF